MLIAFYILAAFCLIATILPLSGREDWWIRAADFPRLQIAVVSVFAVLGVWLSGDRTWLPEGLIILALVAAITFHAAVILPYTSIWQREMRAANGGRAGDTLSVMVANVLMDNRESDRLFATIERYQPDILLAVETDGWWCDRLSDRLSDWPHILSHPIDNTYGMFLASHLELIDPEVRFLLKDDIPSIRSKVRLASGATVMLYALHPEPPSPTEAETALPRDAELVMVAKEIAEHGRNVIVMGDLNDVAWSHTSRVFRRIGRMLDPRVGRGLFSTFHADYWLLRWPLDHVFASDDFVLADIKRLDAFGSDHFPIMVTLKLAPKEAKQQEAERPDGDDLAEAEDKLERSRYELECGSSIPG